MTDQPASADAEGLDFEGFVRLLGANDQEDLDIYDGRLPVSAAATAAAVAQATAAACT